MSEGRQLTSPEFEVFAIDKETEMKALIRALQYSQEAQGFKLLFCSCDESNERNHLILDLRRQLWRTPIQEIHLDRPILHLLDEIRRCIEKPAPRMIFLSGLELSLNTNAGDFFINLVNSRDSFLRDIPCPLVLFGPRTIFYQLYTRAPEFFMLGNFLTVSNAETKPTGLAKEETIRNNALLLRETYRQASSQAHYWTMATLSVTVLGFVMFLVGVGFLYQGKLSSGAVSMVSGLLSEFITVLFMKHSKILNERADSYYKQLTQVQDGLLMPVESTKIDTLVLEEAKKTPTLTKARSRKALPPKR